MAARNCYGGAPAADSRRHSGGGGKPIEPGRLCGPKFRTHIPFHAWTGFSWRDAPVQSPTDLTVRERPLGLTASHEQGPKSGTCMVAQLERPEYPQAVKTARILGPISARITVDPDGYLQAELSGATVFFGKAVETALAKTRLSPADCVGKVFGVSYRFRLDRADEPGAGSFAAFHAPGEFEIREVLPRDEIICIVYSRPALRLLARSLANISRRHYAISPRRPAIGSSGSCDRSTSAPSGGRSSRSFGLRWGFRCRCLALPAC